MNIAELLEQAQAAGVLLVLVDGRLTWEADHLPPAELLAKLIAHKAEIIEALSATNDLLPHAWEWLTRLADLLGCSPAYLLEHGFVDRHDLAEQCHIHPRFAARLICSHPDWCQTSEHSVQEEAAEFREQYARTREGATVDAQLAPSWIAARDAFHAHALGGCPHCYPPLGRYCTTGAELRTRYIQGLETSQ
ncbi:hypothetical protein LF844_23095 [Metapseudomonas lalkuanensis]|uniref:TubC N-terminal docking domain-related protein n=1 Tax=Metapseudomonas lalkuanensis TaxID=2604832 RepID=UPI001CF261CA|nr:hypothetical protein [Pseudomonas lalkuanensis]UCO97515.1 hypothetical protein LF844_23095 [Pseudomonas lalkuanensis]